MITTRGIPEPMCMSHLLVRQSLSAFLLLIACGCEQVTSPEPELTSGITFWTNDSSVLPISVDARIAWGKITIAHQSAPKCGASGVFTLDVPFGEGVSYTATSADGSTWTGSVFNLATCTTMLLRNDSNSGGGSGGGGGNGAGLVAFYTDDNFSSPFTVTINGQARSITRYWSSATPNCGQEGTATFSLPPGQYTYSASMGQLTWNGTVAVTPNGCYRMRLQMPVGGGGGNGGGGGSGNTSRSATACASAPSQSAKLDNLTWNALPTPFSGLDFKVYYSNFFQTYDVIWRNRYQDKIYFNAGAAISSPPNITTHRHTMRAGMVQIPPGSFSLRATPGQAICVRVDNARFGESDTGPYY